MTNPKPVYSALSRLAWGYVLLYFDFKLGTVSVTPAFAGYLLFLSALGPLSEERRSLALLRPLGVLLALWNGADWLLSWAGETVSGHIPFLDVLTGAAAIYFHFQLFTDLAAIAAEYQAEGQRLDRRILRWRTVNVLLQTVLPLLAYFQRWLGQDGMTVIAFVMIPVFLITVVCLTACIFSLRKLFKRGPDAPPGTNPHL